MYKENLQRLIFCDAGSPVLFAALPLPAVLCTAGVETEVLVALVLSQHHPFRSPQAFMLSRGVFIPSSPCRGQGTKIPLRKVPELGDGWNVTQTLSGLCGCVMRSLADTEQWPQYLPATQRELLPHLHGSCIPASLEQTLLSREWLPTELAGLRCQWHNVRTHNGRELPPCVLRQIEDYIGSLEAVFQLTEVDKNVPVEGSSDDDATSEDSSEDSSDVE